jgi:hypothetical protein
MADTNVAILGAAYILGLGLTGFVVGLVRPWLHTWRGQIAAAFVGTFCVYGGVGASDMPTPSRLLVTALVVAVFTTPIWVLGFRFLGIFEMLQRKPNGPATKHGQ